MLAYTDDTALINYRNNRENADWSTETSVVSNRRINIASFNSTII